MAGGERGVDNTGRLQVTRYTHRQLATMIGANRETVTRALGKLRSEEGVELRHRRIFVVNKEALKQVARG